MGGFSQALAVSVLNFFFKGKEEPVKKPEKIFLSLLTVVPTSSSKGSTVTEATGATGYVKKELLFTDMESKEEEEALIQNAVEELFAEITAGSAEVIAFCVTDKSGAKEGNMLAWGTATTVTISATQQPAKIAAKGLKIKLK